MQEQTSGSVLDENWRLNYKGVTNRFKRLLLEKAFLWDVAFQVDSKVFKAHKLVLAIGSPVFEKMFYSDDSESEYMIVITDLDSIAFQGLLSYIYTYNVSFNHISEALSVCKAAEMYDVPELKDLCEKFLIEQDYKPSIVCPVLEKVDCFDLPRAKEKCLEAVKKNPRAVLRSEGFFASSFRVIQMILSLNELSLPEKDLLDTLACWVKKNVSRNSTSRSVFKELLPYIRFKAIIPEEFCAFTEKHPDLLDEHESTMILKHMVKPDSFYLPPWCSRQPPRRNSMQQRRTFAQKLWDTLKNPQLF